MAIDPDEREEMTDRLVTALKESVFVRVAYFQTAKRLLELRDAGKDPDGDPRLGVWMSAQGVLRGAGRPHLDGR